MGRAIRLFNLENEIYSTALEMAAGKKLFNIVVDNENTSRILLQRRCFDTKVFMIPLNKIQSKPITEFQFKLIQENFGNEAKKAIDLVKYDKKYEAAIHFLFGNTLVCSTSEICKKIAYNRKFGQRCVNMEGDIFEPMGTMSGGSMLNKENILIKVQDLNFLQGKIQEIKLSVIKLKDMLAQNNDASKLLK